MISRLLVVMLIACSLPAHATPPGTVPFGFFKKISSVTGPLSLLAGMLGFSGNLDGTGTAARATNIDGIVIDSSGNLFFVDGQTIKKVTTAGVVTTFAGQREITGTTDGTGTAALFNNPRGVAIDSSNNIYVADDSNNSVRKITPAGVVTTFAGLSGAVGALTNGTGTAARFDAPWCLTIDGSGNLYLYENGNGKIRKITTPGAVVTTVGSITGNIGGIAADSAGSNIYITEYFNHIVTKMTSAGAKSTFAGLSGTAAFANGTGGSARFDHPGGITMDSSGNLYVGDTSNDKIRKITTPGAVVTTFSGGSNGYHDGSSGILYATPDGIVVSSTGDLYISDQKGNVIRKLSGGTASTILGMISNPGTANGTGAAAQFDSPHGAATDSSGNVYVADYNNHTIRKITSAGVVTTFAGIAGTSGSTDATGTSASFKNPFYIAIDSSGNLYVSDRGNHTIRKITSAGVVTTLAGSAGLTGTTDATGSAARFNTPQGLAVDSSGNVFVSDSGNKTIRKITSAGVVTTFAGLAGTAGSTDATGSAARFTSVIGMTIDSSDNLYVTESSLHTIRKITPGAVVTTLAGTSGTSGNSDGTGTAALFNTPTGIAADAAGNLYVADYNNHTVRKITSGNVVTTVVGVPHSIGVLLGNLPASLSGPWGLAVSGSTLYIVDLSENSILKTPKP